MKGQTKRQSANTEESSVNYKELYFECKKNVAIFMQHVDREMSEVLRKHQSEKKKLQDEIQRLKNELKHQNQSSTMHFSKASSFQSSHKRRKSQTIMNTQTSVSKEVVEECLSKFANFDFKPKNESKKKGLCSIQRTVKSLVEEQKENHVPSSNFSTDIDLGELKSLNSAPRRDKRMKEKKIQQNGQKMENIKDFLKDIRGRLSSRQKSSLLKQKDEQIISVISPEIFSANKVKNH